MVLISLEDAKAEVRKVVSDFKTRYDINYRLNNLPSIELEDETEQTEPKIRKRNDKPFRAVWLDDDHNEIGTPQTERSE